MTKREELIEQYTVKVSRQEGLKKIVTEHPPLSINVLYKANELVEYASSIENNDNIVNDRIYIIGSDDRVFEVDAIRIRLAVETYFKGDTDVVILCTAAGVCVQSGRVVI